MIDLVRFCVLYVYSIAVFIGCMYSVSAQGIVGRVINARYYYYYYYDYDYDYYDTGCLDLERTRPEISYR